MNEIVEINGIAISKIVFKGAPVVTFKIIDRVHERPVGTAADRFKKHRHRFTHGKHFHHVDYTQKGILSPIGIEVPPRGLTLVTERGYLLLVKTFGDDLAWEVQDRLIDEYFRTNAPNPMKALNDPSIMRKLLLTYSEKVLVLEETVTEQKPKVDVFDRIANSDGITNITTTAKSLQMRPMDLFALMSHKKWIYKRPGGKGWIGYQNRIQQGLLMHKVKTVSTSDGREKTVEQVLVTPKGLTRLAAMAGKGE